MNGLIVPAGQGRTLTLAAQDITFKVTGADGSFASIFEVVVPPGFDVGAHTHDQAEFFYILDGELDVFAFEPADRSGDRWQDWESPDGDRVVRATAGSCIFAPSGCPHAFRNSTGRPARLLFETHPAPDLEHYFEELWQLLNQGRAGDTPAIEELRTRYTGVQLTPLRYEPPGG